MSQQSSSGNTSSEICKDELSMLPLKTYFHDELIRKCTYHWTIEDIKRVYRERKILIGKIEIDALNGEFLVYCTSKKIGGSFYEFHIDITTEEELSLNQYEIKVEYIFLLERKLANELSLTAGGIPTDKHGFLRKFWIPSILVVEGSVPFEIVCTLKFMSYHNIGTGKNPDRLICNYSVHKANFEVGEKLCEMYEAQRDCDVTLKVGNHEIKAHKLILVAASSYFEAMFRNKSMKESVEGIVDLSKDPDIEIEVLRAFIDYIYGSKNFLQLSDYAQDLLLLADKFDVQQLKEVCERYVGDTIRPDNAVDVLILSEKYNFEELRFYAVDFIKQYKEDVKATATLGKLIEHPHLLLELL